MKKSMVKTITLILIAAVLMCSLTACAKKVPSGSYEAEIEIFGQSGNVTYTFSGSKVEAVSKVTILGMVKNETAAGTAEITENPDGSMEITVDFEQETDIFEDMTVTYKEGDGYIELGGVTYTKVEKE